MKRIGGDTGCRLSWNSEGGPVFIQNTCSLARQQDRATRWVKREGKQMGEAASAQTRWIEHQLLSLLYEKDDDHDNRRFG